MKWNKKLAAWAERRLYCHMMIKRGNNYLNKGLNGGVAV